MYQDKTMVSLKGHGRYHNTGAKGNTEKKTDRNGPHGRIIGFHCLW